MAPVDCATSSPRPDRRACVYDAKNAGVVRVCGDGVGCACVCHGDVRGSHTPIRAVKERREKMKEGWKTRTRTMREKGMRVRIR